MFVGILQFELLIRGSGSLKDKRRVVKSVKDQLHREHMVSVAEVGALDDHSLAIMGLAVVSNSAKYAGDVLDRVTNKLRGRIDAELGDTQRDILGGDALTADVEDAAVWRDDERREAEGPPMSIRAQQTSSVIHRAVQSVLVEGLSDPRLDAMITVTSVKVTEDLKTAVVNVSISPERKEALAMHGLRAAARHIRRRIGDLVAIHRAPELVFKVDRGAKREAGVLDALAKIRAERGDSDVDAAQPPEKGPEERL